MATKRTRTTPAKSTRSVSRRPRKTTSQKSTKKKTPSPKPVRNDADMSLPKSASSASDTSPSSAKKFRINGVIAAVLLLIVAAVFLLRNQVVVALVNGQPVWRTEMIQQLEKQGGQETLDGLVMQKLIEQEAREQGVSVTSEDLDTKIAEIEESVTAQGQELDALLELQGMSRDDLRSQLRFQVLLEKLVGDTVSVTDEEIDAFIEEQQDFLQDNPDMAQVREDVRSLLQEQKMSEAAVALTERLREEASINYLRQY